MRGNTVTFDLFDHELSNELRELAEPKGRYEELFKSIYSDKYSELMMSKKEYYDGIIHEDGIEFNITPKEGRDISENYYFIKVDKYSH
ncbi:hypothetical protein [Flagellimonas sp. CMM7]|uniref:hypothetical protein n=1 Tax=Flagellimonas sp. CMM7 TaxID=2654676 RepID=UPI0013CF4953|nr:hypothetical protein [Flagellimonas sp. CMM7]UII81072.1 hypothetical protein LV704_06040 [Flagellimonas sp. CMM7]